MGALGTESASRRTRETGGEKGGGGYLLGEPFEKQFMFILKGVDWILRSTLSMGTKLLFFWNDISPIQFIPLLKQGCSPPSFHHLFLVRY